MIMELNIPPYFRHVPAVPILKITKGLLVIITTKDLDFLMKKIIIETRKMMEAIIKVLALLVINMGYF